MGRGAHVAHPGCMCMQPNFAFRLLGLSRPRPVRVLVVDDSPKVLAALLAVLSDHPDLLVVGFASSAEEALAVGSRARPDVVLLDVRMPGMGGLAAVAHFKRQAWRPLVVLLSLQEDPALRREAHLAGADAFVAKTEVDGDQLIQLLDDLCAPGVT